MVQDLFPASITQLPEAGLGDVAWHSNLSHAGLKADLSLECGRACLTHSRANPCSALLSRVDRWWRVD